MTEVTVQAFQERISHKHFTRRAVILLLMVLCFQDPLLFIVSQANKQFFQPAYISYPPTANGALEIGIVAICSFVIACFTAFSFKLFRQIALPTQFVKALTWSATLSNVVSALFLAHNARYVSGGLTGGSGVLYALSTSLTFLVMLLYVRDRLRGFRFGVSVTLVAFIASTIIQIDGLARALTVFVFLYLMFPVQRARTFIFLGAAGVSLVYIGLLLKFGGDISGVNIQHLVFWIISRFTINAESLNTFLAGHSVIAGSSDFYHIVSKSIQYRIDLVSGSPAHIEFPKSVSEAIYYDLYQSTGSGSSPGFLLSSIFVGGDLLFFIVPIIYAYLLRMYFKNILVSVGILEILAITYLLKGVVSDISEILTVISPEFIFFSFFLFCCFTVTAKAKSIEHSNEH